MTCVELGRACIEEILGCGGAISCVFTLDDTAAVNKSGRIHLDSLCAGAGVPLHKIRNINDPHTLHLLSAESLDWLFVVGWSQIARQEALSLPKRGVLGIHPTLLPEGRGRAAIPWAILKALPFTGATLFRVDDGVDSGPIIGQRKIPLEARETATTLYEKVKAAHRALVRDAWDSIIDGTVRWAPQDHSQATYWPGRTPADGRITSSMTVEEADRLVRAVTKPYPGAYVESRDGILRIWRAEPATTVATENLDYAPHLIRMTDGFLRVLESTLEPNRT